MTELEAPRNYRQTDASASCKTCVHLTPYVNQHEHRCERDLDLIVWNPPAHVCDSHEWRDGERTG